MRLGPYLAVSAVLLVGSLPGWSQGRRQPDVRARIRLDDIAARPSSRVPEVAPLRIITQHAEPGRFQRRPAASRSVSAEPIPPPAAATSPVNYAGFPALLDNYTVIPPDTNGAVGPQHVVTMLNAQMHIQSRTGVARPNYPITLNSFWSSVSNGGNVFDPRILYDSTANRWMVSAAMDSQLASAALLVGVSRTGDPGGEWQLFRFDVGPTNWADYPTLGFNGNWIVVSVNLFRVGANATYRETDLYVFNRTALYQDNDGTYTRFRDNQGSFVLVRDPENRTGPLYLVQAFADPGVGTLRLSKLEGSPGSETFRGGNIGEIQIQDPWAEVGPNDGADFAPQAGTPTRIDTGDDRLQSCMLRSGTIWCAHTVFLPDKSPARAAVQWFQLDPAGIKVLQRGRIEDPAGGYFYAFPSIAVNRNNDVLVGFSRFHANEAPAAAFAFRTASDPADTMQPAVVYKQGEAPYIRQGNSSGRNRWGDFSTTVVDPVDDLTFWTIQEYSSTPSSGRTGRYGTFWAKVTAPSVAPACTFTLSTTAQQTSWDAGSGTLAVTTAAGCPWMAASNVPWIAVVSGTPGSGSGTVTYSLAANSAGTAARTGTITVAGQTFTVTQSAPGASVDLTVTAMTAPASAQAGQTVTLSAVIVNASEVPAATFRVGLYLGNGGSVSTADTLLGACSFLLLAPRGSVSCSQSVVIPASTQPGRYVVGAVADDLRQLTDSDFSNNTRISDTGSIAIGTVTARPQVPANGVVNAASFRGGGVAPGELVTIFGTNFGPNAAAYSTVSPAGVVGTTAGGVRVLFDGVAATMISAIAGQATAIAPFALRARTSTQMQVEYNGVRSDAITLEVAQAAPAVFSANQSGTGQGAILNEDYAPNGPMKPAAPGSTVMLFGTGIGYQQESVEGVLAQPPFANMAQQVSVRVAGLPAVVTYAGTAPGLVTGVAQVNAVVPAGVTPGEAVPVTISVAGVAGLSVVTLVVR